MTIYNSVTELVGKTPLVKLNSIEAEASVYAKLEFFNPTSSIKDRIAVNMINDAEKSGSLTPGGTIIEPTSGNTGVGLAMVAASRGYKLIITMPETMSMERRALMKQFGAEIVLTEGTLGMKGAIDKAVELQETIKNSFIPQQFNNSANPQIHTETTAQEIWNDTEGEVDIFVAAVGTGGTITGTARGLKAHNENIQIVAVEPKSSAVLSGESAGKHAIQGIGAGFVPEIVDTELFDEIITIADQDAIKAAQDITAQEGILCGISSGANICAAIELAKRPENKGKKIVTIICDTGERYLSTELFRHK